MARFINIFRILMATIFVSFSYGYKYNICALTKYRDSCSQIERNNNIKCTVLVNDASCLNEIESGKLHFGAVSAEAAFLAAPFSPKVNVLAKILESGDDYKYEIVVVTNKQVTSFAELKDFTYCHPGIDTTDVSPYLLQQLESKILDEEKSNDCDNDLTVSENYIKKLNDFFGPSCRHGRWVQDERLDAKLKTAYKSLTARCNMEENITDGATTSYLEKSMECFKKSQDGAGALAITTRNTILNTTGLYYLCKNGSAATEPCVWAQQPYRLIVTNNSTDMNTELLEDLRSWFADNYKPSIPIDQSSTTLKTALQPSEIEHLKKVLEMNRGDDFTNISRPLSNYTASLRDTPSRDRSKLCKTSMKWCTISDDEQRKCDWLSQASLNYGIQPVVECKQSPSKMDCIKSISDSDSDLVMIEADLGYIAKKKGLSAIAFPETESTQEIRTILLVKNTSDIARIENIKGKKGCFSRYGDIAWISFIDVVRGVIADQGSCDYGKIITDAVGPSCMPVNLDKLRVISDTVDKVKMCALCKEKENNTCDVDDTNEFYGDSGAVRCLEMAGDFAVFTKPVPFSLPANTRILCKNGTLAPEGLTDVDDDCYLSVLTTSEIVTRRGDKKNKDIELALLEFDHWFAVRDSPFRLFDSFHQQPDLLFKDSTPGLDRTSSEKKAIKSYVEVFKKVDDCAGANMTETPDLGKTNSTSAPNTNEAERLKTGTFWIVMILTLQKII